MDLSHRSHQRTLARSLLIVTITLLALVWPNLGSRTLPQASAAQASGPVILGDSIPQPVQQGKATYVGAYNPNQILRLVIGLQPPQLAAEEQYLQDIQNKHSPLFHHFLTAAEWNARFSPSAQDEQAVVTWIQSQSLTVTQRYPDHLIVDVAAPVHTIEKAFNVTINTYNIGTRTFFSNDRAPTIPTSLSGIVETVLGMDSWQVLQPASASQGPTGLQGPVYVDGPVAAVGPSDHANGDASKLPASLKKGTHPNITNGSYDPTDLYSSQAYNVAGLYNQGHCCNPTHISGGTGPLTSIGIATAFDFQISDIKGFHNQYPFLAVDVTGIFVDGTPSCCNVETTMDIEWATAMSNSFGCFCDTASVYAYEGANAQSSTFTDVYHKMLSDGKVRSFTTSWGCTEFTCTSNGTMNTDHNIFNAMVGQGWSLTAASGDKGAYDDCTPNIPRVQYPSSDPDMVAAGGSTLFLNGNGTFNSEVAWTGPSGSCGNNTGGGGGGLSAKWPTPPYQSGLGFNTRATPDVSLNAVGGQNIYFKGALSGNGGGTSIVAPELAGLFAQEDAYLLSEGNICGIHNGTLPCAPMGNPNYAIYNAALGNSGASLPPHNPFYDITVGCNGNGAGPGYCAGTGYDLATGWGSFNWLQMAWAMNWNSMPDSGRPAVTFSGPATGQWYNTDQMVSWTVADTGGSAPPSGVVGFSQAWDVDPGDPTSGNPGCCSDFYGPQFPNVFTGSLSLVAAGQGCHTVHVEAWDNMGFQSGDQTYGQLCYDFTRPQTKAKLSGTLNGGSVFFPPVTVKLTASDSLSGVASTRYQIDGGTEQTYTGPFTVSSVGKHTVTYYSIDNANNVEAVQSISFTIVQWTSQTSGTTNNLRAIGCTNTSVCEVGGVNGTILGTTDGGTTWNQQTSGTTNTLNAVTCRSTSICFAVGDAGTILGTTDGGTTWSKQISGTTNTLNGVGCMGTAVCVAVGANGTILATADGGTTWKQQTSGTTTTLNGVSCVGTSTCTTVGANGTILATADGGTTWSQQTSGTTTTLNGVSCEVTSTCIAVGANGTILATTDGGTTWSQQTSGTTNTLNGVRCASTSICLAAGANGTILGSSNGGTSWKQQPSNTTITLYSVRCLSISTGYAVGDQGTILRKG